MSESTNPLPTPEPADQPAVLEPDLRQELYAVRALALRLQSAMIALSIIVGMFIFVQYWRTKNELNGVRQFIAASKQKEGAVNQFLTQLVDYSRTHPDFVPIISKYPIQIQSNSPTNPAAAPTTAPKPNATPPAPGTAPKK